jgi:hypothetical protein
MRNCDEPNLHWHSLVDKLMLPVIFMYSFV